MNQAGDSNWTTYAAFLRGINLGNRRMKMAELRQALETAGYRQVKSFLASGNVLLETVQADPDMLAEQIEGTLQATFGYEVKVIVRTLAALQEIVAADPFAGVTVTPDTRLYVTFLPERPETTLEIPYETPDGGFRILDVTDGEVFSVLTLSPGRRTVDLMNVLEQEFGRGITTRNWNTVRKMVA